MADMESVRWAIESLKFCKQKKSELKELEEQARLAIEEALGDDDTGTLDGHVAVTWKFHKRTALDQKALKASFPDVYETCRATTEVRRFEVVDD